MDDYYALSSGWFLPIYMMREDAFMERSPRETTLVLPSSPALLLAALAGKWAKDLLPHSSKDGYFVYYVHYLACKVVQKEHN